MSLDDALVWPPGWARTTVAGGRVATSPRRSPTAMAASLEWRAGPPPAHDDVEVEDEDAFEVGGHPVGYRRFGHRVAGREVVSEEWTWEVDGVAHVLTGTVPREDYLEVCEVFEAAAASVDPAQLGGSTASPAASRRSRSATAWGSVRSS